MSFMGFLDDLERSGLMNHVRDPVSPVQEVTERSWGSGPILFDDVSGHKCCLNILGTRDLLARALGVPAGDMVRHLSQIGCQGPVREVDWSSFMENVSQPDLSKLPIMTYFPGDGGPYITSGVVSSRFEGRINACVHRLMVLGKDRLAARLVPGRHTHQFYEAARAKGEEVPVAVAMSKWPIMMVMLSTAPRIR